MVGKCISLTTLNIYVLGKLPVRNNTTKGSNQKAQNNAAKDRGETTTTTTLATLGPSCHLRMTSHHQVLIILGTSQWCHHVVVVTGQQLSAGTYLNISIGQ